MCKGSQCYKSSSLLSASITSPSSSLDEPSITSELLPKQINDPEVLSGEAVKGILKSTVNLAIQNEEGNSLV